LSNAEIADRLASLAQLLSTQKENLYKVKAYRRASARIRTFAESLDEMVREGADLTGFAGIGEGIAAAIREIVLTGTLGKFDKRGQASPALADLRGCLKRSCRFQPIQHQADGRDVDHSLRTLHRVFVVFAQAPIPAEPRKAPFHDPRQARDLEGALASFDDLQFPAVLSHQFACKLLTLMAGIGDHDLNSRE
jgi:hypothetical protein